MSKTNVEQMQKIIDAKKKKSSEQGLNNNPQDKSNKALNKQSKNTKRGGSLNK